MNCKLLALDVDGTLLDDEHRLSPVTAAALCALADQGIEIVLCTGRSPTNAAPYLREIGLEGMMITHNGATTVQSETMEVVDQQPITLEEILPFIRYCRENRIHFDICTPFHLYVEQLTAEEQQMYTNFMLEPVVHEDLSVFREPMVKFTIFGTKETMDKVEQDWRSWNSELNIIRSHLLFIDIMNPLASKGNALRQLAGKRNVTREQIVAIGNYYNDLDMLQYAGLGIAMENSPEDLKQQADAVTASNNDNGVYQALKKYIL